MLQKLQEKRPETVVKVRIKEKRRARIRDNEKLQQEKELKQTGQQQWLPHCDYCKSDSVMFNLHCLIQEYSTMQ